MTAIALIRPTAGARAVRRDVLLFLLALGAIALHVVDDNYLQPEPGTGAGDHLVSGLVPLGLLGLAASVYPRLRGCGRGAFAVACGVLGLAAGVEGLHYAREVGPSGDDFSRLLALPAGLLLLGLGAATLRRTRRRDGSRAWRYGRRALVAVPGALGLMVVGFIGYGYVSTHVGRAVVPDNRLGVASEDVTFTTSDGLELEGWYIPSKNGAAVIAFPGRKAPQPHARMLARHGYGVLLFDRRGEGASEGAWGWGGDRDVKAAISFLRRRPDVDAHRIGGIGLSVGGELMLETAAETDQLAAVVSEGAGARTTSETLDHADATLTDKLVGGPLTGSCGRPSPCPRTRSRPRTSGIWSDGSRRGRCC
jgi:MYXO-CTERM domain-containing protein